MQLQLKLSQVRNKIKRSKLLEETASFMKTLPAMETGVLKTFLLLLLPNFREGWPTEFLPYVPLTDSSLYYLNIFTSSDLILNSYQNESSKGINSKCEVASKSSYRSFPRAVRLWQTWTGTTVSIQRPLEHIKRERPTKVIKANLPPLQEFYLQYSSPWLIHCVYGYFWRDMEPPSLLYKGSSINKHMNGRFFSVQKHALRHEWKRHKWGC